MVFCIAWVLISVAFNYFGDKDTKSFGIMARFPHLFYIIKAKCGRRCAVFAIFARQFFLQTASIRREAVVALLGVDALHVVGGQGEVEDVKVLGDVGRSYFRFCSVFIILMGFGSCSHIVID